MDTKIKVAIVAISVAIIASGAIYYTLGKGDSTGTPENEPSENEPTGLEPSPTLENLAIAHYMTGNLPFRYGESFWIDPWYYDPKGSTWQVGGAMLHAAIPALLHQSIYYPVGLKAENAILLELKAAQRFGLNGFDFYYPWNGNANTMSRYNEIISDFFEVAENHGIDFKFTITVSHPGAGERKEKIQKIGNSIGELVDQVGENHPNWLRTPENRLFFYTWQPDVLYYGWDGYQTRNNPKMIENTAEAFENIEEVADVDAAWMYDLHYALEYPKDKDYVNAALNHFYGVKGWVTNYNQKKIWDYVAEQAKKKGKIYSQEVCGDFFTGKLYTSSPPSGGIYNAGKASEVFMNEVNRWWKVFNLTKNFRQQLELAENRDADMINLTSWNDYPEGHHIAPEINHNFGFAQLFQYGVAQWRDRPEQAPSDIAIAAFKKYPVGVTPEPFDISMRVDPVCGDPSVENVIEVITILEKPGKVKINDHEPIQADAGIDVTRVKMGPGHVNVTVTRDGEVVAELTTPEAITTDPFRTDRLTYTFSSNHQEIYEYLYGGNAPVYSSNQYATKELVDGPNYGVPGENIDIPGGENEGPPTQKVKISRTEQSPKIDGSIDEVWKGENLHDITKVAVGSREDNKDISANWRALWDKEYLYLMVDVTDDIVTRKNADAWWGGDSVEIYIDGNNSKGMSYDGEDDFQLGFAYEEDYNYTGMYSVKRTFGIERAWADTEPGYRLEAKIPWETIGISPASGDAVGLDVAVNNNDGEGRETQIFWNDPDGVAFRDPSVFGTIILKTSS